MERKFFDWVLIFLIILFFSIPLCALIINESITIWPKFPTALIYNFFLK